MQLIARFEVGMIVGSSSNGTAKPPDVPVRDRAQDFSIASFSSAVNQVPVNCLPNARLLRQATGDEHVPRQFAGLVVRASARG